MGEVRWGYRGSLSFASILTPLIPIQLVLLPYLLSSSHLQLSSFLIASTNFRSGTRETTLFLPTISERCIERHLTLTTIMSASLARLQDCKRSSKRVKPRIRHRWNAPNVSRRLARLSFRYVVNVVILVPGSPGLPLPSSMLSILIRSLPSSPAGSVVVDSLALARDAFNQEARPIADPAYGSTTSFTICT